MAPHSFQSWTHLFSCPGCLWWWGGVAPPDSCACEGIPCQGSPHTKQVQILIITEFIWCCQLCVSESDSSSQYSCSGSHAQVFRIRIQVWVYRLGYTG